LERSALASLNYLSDQIGQLEHYRSDQIFDEAIQPIAFASFVLSLSTGHDRIW
jgi:hypothetical protein